MRKMKDSGVEWIGLIPKDWMFARIGSLYGLRVEKVSDRDYQPLSVTKLGILPQLETVAKTDAHDARKLVKKGDFAINSRSDRRGSCGISEYDGSVSLINTVLYPITEMSPQYYNWFFHTTEFADEFYRWGHGIVDDLWTTGWQEMKNIVIVQPPLSEQCRIAAYLDHKCSEIDALTADIKKQIETLEEYKRSVITEAVTKGLDPDVEMKDSGVEWVGEIPANWEIHPLYCYFGERKRINILGKEDNLLSLSYGKVIQKDINALGGLLPESFNTYNIIEPNDIIIRPTDLQNDKRSLRTGLCTQHGIITTAYIALKPIVKLNSAFFHYLLHSFDVAKVFYNMGNGVRQGLNFGEFSKLTVFFPSLQEQDKIAAYLDRKCSEIDCIIKDKKQQLETLSEYKKSLIYEYVTGKKVVAAEITVSMVDPLLLLIAKILDNMPLNEGKIRVIKLALLSEYMYIPELETQYYRYKQGPYDVNIDKRLNEINKLGWFDISVDESPMKWKKGKKYNKFKQQSQQYDQYDDKITALINSIGHYKESHIGRIATLFSVWNDFIIEGIPNPSDEQIIQEVINNWTPNKAKTAKSVWQHTLDEMKTKGIIPHGKGLHTKKREENT